MIKIEKMIVCWREKISKIHEELVAEIAKSMAKNPFNFCSLPISSIKDIQNLTRHPGFYVICTNYNGTEVKNNHCTYETNDGLKAIYRGQAYDVRGRIKSHLFIEQAKFDLYPVRMKLFKDANGKKIEGVDIGDERLKTSKWQIDYIELPKSIASIREAFEDAFDQKYGGKKGKPPVLCRDKK